MGFWNNVKDLFTAESGASRVSGPASAPDCEAFSQRDYCWQEYLGQAVHFPFGPPPYGPEVPPDELPEALKDELDFFHPYAVFKLPDGYRIVAPGARTPSGLQTIMRDCSETQTGVQGVRFDKENFGFKSRWFDIVLQV